MSVVNSTKKERKVILHFDQHNTIQVACKLPWRDITVEDGLNNFLTTVTWGEETDDGTWCWRCDEPQLEKPRPFKKSVTYFKYLEKLIVKSPEDRVSLRKMTCNFVFEEPGVKFRAFYDLYLKNLKYDIGSKSRRSVATDDPLRSLPANTVIGSDNQTLYHFILPAFFDLIRRLQRDKRDFSIILRTMGLDTQSFLETIKLVFEGKHPDFKDIDQMNINPIGGHIRRDDNNKVELEFDGEIYKNEKDIYEKLSSIEGICAIRDDFAYWQKNNYECYSAKPLWVDLDDHKHQHILFDDNNSLDSYDNCIVNLRLFKPDMDEFLHVDFGAYYLFKHCSIIKPNLLEILDPLVRNDLKINHYYDKLHIAERKYDRILKNYSHSSIDTISQSNNATTVNTWSEESVPKTSRHDGLRRLSSHELVQKLQSTKSKNMIKKQSTDTNTPSEDDALADNTVQTNILMSQISSSVP